MWSLMVLMGWWNGKGAGVVDGRWGNGIRGGELIDQI